MSPLGAEFRTLLAAARRLDSDPISTQGPGLFAWGLNSSGQLGLGHTANRSSPVQVGALSTWTAVGGGIGTPNFTSALKSDGTLWVWGLNSSGQLGLGDTTNRNSPVQVGALTTWTAVERGTSHTLALKSDGTLWAWGANSLGQLGLGDVVNRSSPVQVGALTTWIAMTGGENHTVALKSDGTLWVWGRNHVGQLGLGDTANRSSPVQVGALTTWTAVGGDIHSTFALKSDGTLWTWGLNDFGQLGLGDTANRSSPVQVGALTTWTALGKAGTRSALALKSDGTLWTWGVNEHGRLGLGDVVNRSSPVQVGALTTWTAVVTGGQETHTLALKSDGTLWAWGRSQNGQLGLDDTASRSSPVQVGALTTWTAVRGGYYHTVALN